MASSIHRGAATGRAASIAAERRGAELRLTTEQQEYLVAHGFGPGAASTDFADAEVRARLVRVLRECGALSSDGPARRASRRGRHRLRAG